MEKNSWGKVLLLPKGNVSLSYQFTKKYLTMKKLILSTQAAMALLSHPMQSGCSRLDEYIFISPCTGEKFVYDGHWNTRFVGVATPETISFLEDALGDSYQFLVTEA